MIKINLLPKTLNQKAILRNTAILFGVILLVLVAAGVGYSFRLQAQVDQEEQIASDTEAWSARVKGIQEQTSQVLASVQPIQQKLDFINGVLKYNLEFPKLYEEVAKWTYAKAVVDSIQSDGSVVTLQARVKNLDDLGRYMLNMYCATDLFTEVRITQATGFDSKDDGSSQQQLPDTMGQEISGSQATKAGINAISGSVGQTTAQSSWISFTAVCRLKNPIAAPSFAGKTGAPGAPGSPGAPSVQPMPPGGPGGPSQRGPDGLRRDADGDINPGGM